MRYNKLTLKTIYYKYINNTTKQRMYGLFFCDCGQVTEKLLASVKCGHVKSCGCLYRDNLFKKDCGRQPVNYFDSNDELTYYWAGFLFGDGHLDKNGKLQIDLSNNKDGYIHLVKLSNFIYGANFVNKYQNISCLQVSNSILAKNLYNFGIIPNKTYGGVINIPNKNNVAHFIRGYFDADGWATIKNDKKILKNKMKTYRYLTIGVCSYLEQNLHIVQRYLPCKSYINKKRNQELYELRIHSQREVIKFIDFIKPDNKINCLECNWSKIWNFLNV